LAVVQYVTAPNLSGPFIFYFQTGVSL